MAQAAVTRRPQRRRTAKMRIRYHESDSDLDHTESLSTHNDRPTRSARNVTTYREISDQDDTAESGSESTSGDEVRTPSSANRRMAASGSSRVAAASSERKRDRTTPRQALSFSSFKRQKLGTQQGTSKSSDRFSVVVQTPPKTRIPPWQQLPFHVLLHIMKFAAYPLYEKASRSTPSIAWLCETSTLCRSFHEAAIAVLLRSPPLYPSYRAHGLLDLLRKDQASLITNYRTKIKRLDIEVKNLLIRKSGIVLSELLQHTPLLENLQLYHNHDDLGTIIWAQPSASKDKWAYPEQTFQTLESQNIVLKSFSWNGRFPRPLDTLQTMLDAHSRTPFSRLSTLTLVNLNLPDKTLEVDKISAGKVLVAALYKLPELQHIAFINCNIANASTVPVLPLGLRHLEFDNCSSLTSPDLEQYLRNGGSTIRQLVLTGNQAMSLGFIAGLKTYCNVLQHLHIDLTYTDPTSYRDRDPLYDELLPNGPPSWPETLVSLSTENLRQLSIVDAEAFLDSLVKSAGSLPYLKILNIKAILNNASWKDRAGMRKKWTPKLEYVFLNTTSPALPSKRTGKTSSRQSTRIAKSQLTKMSLSDGADDSDTSSSSPYFGVVPPARQGRCDVVQLSISDQRPAQDQYHEADFLDDEPSDDEEWTGRGSGESNGYAW